MLLLRSSDYRAMPWKNGKGVTTEIAVSPPGAGMDDFDWRISMARVDEDGPFSVFPGIDRTLAILDGEGLRLEVQGRAATTLAPNSVPAAFPGDVATYGRLLAGPITDLNVMTRRGRYAATVSKHELPGATTMPVSAETICFCTTGTLQVKDRQNEATACARDSILFERGVDRATLEAIKPATYFLIGFVRV